MKMSPFACIYPLRIVLNPCVVEKIKRSIYILLYVYIYIVYIHILAASSMAVTYIYVYLQAVSSMAVTGRSNTATRCEERLASLSARADDRNVWKDE